jgi:hypothetical protein
MTKIKFKKILLYSIIYSIFLTNLLFANSATFNSHTNTVELPCVRISQNGAILNLCYPVNMSIEGSGLLITEISNPYTTPVESDDQVYYADNRTIYIPVIHVIDNDYSVELHFTDSDLFLEILSVQQIPD